ncbi:MAG TPA: TIGR03619 family F420-dependent LLM class oxidoreductase [Steroidobacteraceae bacterium]
MRIGFVIQNQGNGALEQVRELAPIVESLGFHSVWLTDHVVGVRAFAQWGYGPYWLECLTGLAYMAAQTKTIRIGTSILVAPVRDPVYAAKVLSTLDNLSNGRLNVGIGTGWSKAEFHALGRGALHEKRGAVTDETLELILRCWQGGSFDWTSDHFNFRQMEFAPTPVQTPHPPLLIGGPAIPAVAKRIARFGDAWHPAMTDWRELEQQMKLLNELAGRPVPVVNRLIIVPSASSEEIHNLLAAFKAIGCVETVVDFRPADRVSAHHAAERAMRAYGRISQPSRHR